MNIYYIRSGLVCGRVVTDSGGFRWVPFSTAHRISRKAWPTPEAAIAGRIRGGRLIRAENLKHAIALAKGEVSAFTCGQSQEV
jgi:hypothetical protein